MASLQRQPSRRRQSPGRSHSSQPQSPVRTRSATSEDSQTLVLNSKTVQDEDRKQEEEKAQDQTQTQTQSPPLPVEDDPSVMKCWICFSDSTEDTVETSPWRDPCPCALVAHEACLLDWIADTEAPKNSGRGGSLKGPQILCPQCKSEIKLARPRNYVVDAAKLLDRVSARLVMPGGVVVLSADVLYKISFAHGVHSVYRIFGTTDADRILRPVLANWARPPLDFDAGLPEIRTRALQSLQHYLRHWRLYLGLPLITPVLLFSRTNWHLSEGVMTLLPTVFFALQPSLPNEEFEFGRWPPSASMAFALLPYARQAYNYYYERVWGERERRWKQEVLPPTSQSQAETADNNDPIQAIEEVADEENVFEVRIDGGIWEEWEEGAPGEERQPNNAPAGQQEDQAAPAPNVPDNRANRQAQDNGRPPNQQRARQQVQAERRLSFSPAALAESVLGALAFPTIAELSGEVLRLSLPKAWTAIPVFVAAAAGNKNGFRVGAKGILQEKWGRSLIGGCLFVVLKDALMLYVRWKMAQMHRNRRVLDYDRSKPKAKS